MLNTKIGILGGGQLGKMLIESFSPLNLTYTILETSSDCPASIVCSNLIEGSLYDQVAISHLAQTSDVLTYEIEHVNVQALEEISKTKKVIPYPSVLKTIQDKGLQKEFYSQQGIATLGYRLATETNLSEQVQLFEDKDFVLKHRKGGYDGRGVQLMDKEKFKILKAQNDLSLSSPDGFVIEKLAKEAVELSVIVAVAQDLSSICYEPTEMVFDPKANLMDYLICPSNCDDQVLKSAKELATNAVHALQSPGIFAVELFVTKGNEVFVNEIAPRPHNSGHHTIESSFTSQYEQLNRILLNLPLGNTDRFCAALTANILGPENVVGAFYMDGMDEVLKIKGVYVHLYGKSESKPFRKIGHFTVLAENTDLCIQKMKQVRECLSIKAMN